jgi:putative transposase
MIEPEHPLSITRHCALLELSRWSVYCRPVPASAQDLVLMRRLDELHSEHPWMGSRSLRNQLRWAGTGYAG